MEINENWKIESDDLNVTLFHRNTGAKSFRPVAYFSNVKDCLEKMVKLEVQGTGLKDFSTVCKKIDELTALINTIKTPLDALESAPRITKVKSRRNGRADAVTTT